jgi:hypothetical protein
MPGAPLNLASSVQGDVVTLTWVPSTHGGSATSYLIEVGSVAGSANLGTIPTGGGSTTVIARAVPTGTYYVRVRALNVGGTSPPSNEIQVFVGGTPCFGVPTPPFDLRVTVDGASLNLAWNAAGPLASSYLIEAGSSSGAVDIASVNTGSSATSLRASGVPSGTYYIRVRARGECGASAPSNEVIVVVPERPRQVSSAMKDFIEALFLGTGRWARPLNPGCGSLSQRMRGWPVGSRVRVVGYNSLDPAALEAVQRALPRVISALGTRLVITYETSPLPEPDGAPLGQVSVFSVDQDRLPAFCPTAIAACSLQRGSNVYLASRAVLVRPWPVNQPVHGIVAHELGHSFGLCHVDPTRGGQPSTLSVMGNSSAGGWTPMDIQAVQMVYEAGLVPGDARERFVAAGLIH